MELNSCVMKIPLSLRSATQDLWYKFAGSEVMETAAGNEVTLQ